MLRTKLFWCECIIVGLLITTMLSGCDGGGSGGEAEAAAIPIVSVSGREFRMSIPDCDFTVSRSQIRNTAFDRFNRPTQFEWTLTPEDGNCAGESVFVVVSDITYDFLGNVVRATYTFEGELYDVDVV